MLVRAPFEGLSTAMIFCPLLHDVLTIVMNPYAICRKYMYAGA